MHGPTLICDLKNVIGVLDGVQIAGFENIARMGAVKGTLDRIIGDVKAEMEAAAEREKREREKKEAQAHEPDDKQGQDVQRRMDVGAADEQRRSHDGDGGRAGAV